MISADVKADVKQIKDRTGSTFKSTFKTWNTL